MGSKKSLPHVPMNLKTSCHNNGSESSLLHCRPGLPKQCLGLIANKNKNDVTLKERGVQTIQETPASSLRREASQQTDCATVLTGELLQLSGYLTEALHREQNLEKKLCVLQEHLSGLEQISEKSWMAQRNEDHLKCKVTTLENQLFYCTQTFPETRVKELLLEMEDQKLKYQEKAKESLQKLSDAKIATEGQLQKVQMSLSTCSKKCKFWKKIYNCLKSDWNILIDKHNQLKDESGLLLSKLQLLESRLSECQPLPNPIQGLEEKQRELQALGEHLHELQEEKLRSLQGRLRNSEEQKLEFLNQIMAFQTALETLEERSKSDTATLLSQEKEYAGLQAKVTAITDEYRSCQKKLKRCREKLKEMTRQTQKKLYCFWMPVLMISSVVTALFISSYMG